MISDNDPRHFFFPPSIILSSFDEEGDDAIIIIEDDDDDDDSDGDPDDPIDVPEVFFSPAKVDQAATGDVAAGDFLTPPPIRSNNDTLVPLVVPLAPLLPPELPKEEEGEVGMLLLRCGVVELPLLDL